MIAQRISVKPAKIFPPEGRPFVLDLACGDNKREGFLGIDISKTASTDYVFDLLEYPWPIDDSSVDMLNCSHFFEHIPGKQRALFMDECWRILKPACQLVIVVPYYSSMRAIQDFCHEWPPVCESSFVYFNKKWREENKLLHGPYAMKCDFDVPTFGYVLDPEIDVRNNDFKTFSIKHYLNANHDLHVTLSKRT